MTGGLRWAILGASGMARQHMVAAIRAAGGEIVAAQSGDARRAEAFAAEFGLPMATSSLEQAAARAEAVYISSANAAHCAQTLRALAAGCHVLCEKPVAVDLDEARAMIAAAARAGRVLAVNHHLRHTALHARIRRELTAGAIGAVRAVSLDNAGWLPAELRGWRLEGPGGGIALDKTVHDVDLLRFLLGREPASVIAATSGPAGRPARAITGVLDFGDGVSARFHDDFDAPFGQTRLEIIGEAGRLIAEDCLSGRPAGILTIADRAGRRPIPVDHHNPYTAVIADFHRAAREGTPVAASGRDGAIALAAALAAVRSARTGSRTAVAPFP